MDKSPFVYVAIEVGGIQKYIFATGKLKEMIGASQIVYIVADSLPKEVAKELGLTAQNEPQEGTGWYLVLQNNAGALRLLMPDMRSANKFMQTFSRMALARFPGLPLFGTATEGVQWSVEGLSEARRKSTDEVNRQRATSPVPAGMLMQPFVQAARLDGLPAVQPDKNDTAISLLSEAKRAPSLLNAATERLKITFNDALATVLPKNTEIVWPDDFALLCNSAERARIALIHIDGNDLGKLFLKKSEEGGGRIRSATESTRAMAALSCLVDESNTQAFLEALVATVKTDLKENAKNRKSPGYDYVVPIRPLLMGGDDLTLIVRADLALPMVDAFVSAFEKITAEKGEALSVGAGMLIMPASYPFAKAISLVEELMENAKKLTANKEGKRPSSLDYLVLTGDVEADLRCLRQRVYTANDGRKLTAKPYILAEGWYARFRKEAWAVLHDLPRSHTRPALEACRMGDSKAREAYTKLLKNLERGLGGRKDARLMKPEELRALFGAESFFDAEGRTRLTDYIELASYIKEADHA